MQTTSVRSIISFVRIEKDFPPPYNYQVANTLVLWLLCISKVLYIKLGLLYCMGIFARHIFLLAVT